MLKTISKEELDLMSYTDITYHILKENNMSLNTPKIFKEVCNVLGYDQCAYEDKIGDFYTSLTLDKRFVLLDNFDWDLRERNNLSYIDDYEEDEEEAEEMVDDSESANEEDNEYDDEKEEKEDTGDDDIEEDEFEDLAIIGEEDLEE